MELNTELHQQQWYRFSLQNLSHFGRETVERRILSMNQQKLTPLRFLI